MECCSKPSSWPVSRDRQHVAACESQVRLAAIEGSLVRVASSMEALIKHSLRDTAPPGLRANFVSTATVERKVQILEDRTQRIELLLLLADVQKIDEAIERLLYEKQSTPLKQPEDAESPDDEC